MKLDKTAKRLLIYFFYDKEGIVDDYVTYLLDDMKKNVSDILFVSNGKLDKDSREKVLKITEDIYERKNEGFDVWAYKTALQRVGWTKLRTDYDEVILMNYTIMGPVYPFKEMFDKMDNTDVDFWGITAHMSEPNSRTEVFKKGLLEHLQTSFIAIRSKMLVSKEFKSYWDKLPAINDMQDSFDKHEAIFTKHFEKKGFKWKTYVDAKDLEGYTFHPILYAPVQLIEQNRCPVFSRESFAQNYVDVLRNTVGENAPELMKFLDAKTDYDTNMIWDNILRCYPMGKIKDCMQLNYTLPEVATAEAEKNYEANKPKVALVFHVYFMDLLDSTYRYVSSMPSDADIYLTVAGEEKIKKVKERFKEHKFNKLEILPIENRGRDVSALLVPTKDFIMDYDYVCFAHDKKTAQMKPESIGAGFAYQCLENTLGTEGYVKNVIDLFEQNPRLGILMPPPPFHSSFLPALPLGWGPNFNATEKLAKRLNLKVPMNPNVSPISPLGTMFWFRAKGMKKLFDYDWEYKDFPKEPNKNDGTLLHAIERVYGLVEQEAGYYGAWGISDKFASILITNSTYMLSGFLSSLLLGGAPCGFYHVLIQYMQQQNVLANTYKAISSSLISTMSLVAPNFSKYKGSMRLYFSDNGELNEDNSVWVNTDDTVFNHTFKLPRKMPTGSTLRFDPEENGGLILSNLEINMLLDDGNELEILPSDYRTNGIILDNKLVFKDEDPMVTWTVESSSSVVAVKISAHVERDASTGRIDSLIAKHNERIFGKVSDLDVSSMVAPDNTFRLYFDDGSGFSEKNSVALNKYEVFGSTMGFELPPISSPIVRMRFDPGEERNISLDVRSILIKTESSEFSIKRKDLASNGRVLNGKYIFLQNDPWIMWKLPSKTYPVSVKISADVSSDVVSELSPFVLSKSKKQKMR